MTDKQIIIDGVDVSRCGLLNDWRYYCEIFEERCSKKPNCYYKRLIRKEQECETLASQLDFEVQKKECLEQECERLKHDNGYKVGALERTIDNLKAENEELKKIIDEAKNSKLDLKSFLVGETIQKEYEQQLDQLKAENDTLKQYKASKQASYESMQREWNQAVNENRELKADNKHLNDLLNQALKELEELQNLKDEDSLRVVILARENERLKELLAQDQCFQDKSHKCVKSFYIDERHKQAIEKVRELCQKDKDFCVSCEGDGHIDCIDCTEGGKAKLAVQILQICDEVNDETTNN